MSKNNLLFVKLLGFATWLIVSFYAIYYLIARDSHFPSWRFASVAFAWYLFTIFPVSIIAAYLLIRSYIPDISKRIKVLISLAGILLMISFASIQWVTLTTRYGNIESFRLNGAAHLGLSYEEEKLMSIFEKEQLYHQTIVANYDIVFKKILLFMLVTFLTTSLSMKIIHR